ncbi:MAG: YceI family protein, partial [Candidatus Kuenenia stuttgartiensis]|nr:YceI family protein [Candidatus Kuenenia stuttgartiensis]
MQLTKITTGAALAVFLLASCGGKTNTVQLASEQEVAVATEASKEYVVDAASSILKWRGSKLTKDHFGTIQIESGKVNLENEAIKAGTFLIDMKTIVVEDIKEEEYNAKLRNHLASEDFFNIDKFPTAKFDITSSEKLATPDEKGNNYIIKG